MPKSPPKTEKKKENYLVLPDDFEMPPTEDGGTFEAVAEIRKEPDGKFCVVSLDGVPLKEDKEDMPDEEMESLGAGAKMAMKGGY